MAQPSPKPGPLPIPDSESSSEWSYGLIPIRILPSLSTSTASPPSASKSTANPTATTQNTQILLIQQHPRPLAAAKGHTPFWSFPKGHPEKRDADPLHTAMREVWEETGLVVREGDVLFADAEPLIERYRNPLRLWVKEVRYWIALVDAEASEVTLQEQELAASRWCSWDEAEGLLTFERGRGILRRVRELLDGNREQEGAKL